MGQRQNEISKEVLIEYQKAQDSAEHYNTMTWTLVSMGIGFSLTILYMVVVLDNIKNPLLNLIALFTGAFVLFYFSFLIESAYEKKVFKYKICQKIERKLGFIGQNCKVEKLPISGLDFKGVYIFRGIKLLLFIFYILAIIIYVRIESNLLLFAFVCIIVAIIGSTFMEVYYCTRNYDFEEVLK